MTSGACGFLFTHAPPDGHEQLQHFSCTESNAGPIIDIIWGGLNVLGAIAAASEPEYPVESGPVVAIGLSWGVVSAASATVGFSKSKRCRAAKLKQRPKSATPFSGIRFSRTIWRD
jgi:hypothetical protein